MIRTRHEPRLTFRVADLRQHHASPVQGYVLGLVDHTHPAAAELLDDPVVRNGLADHAAVSLPCATML